MWENCQSGKDMLLFFRGLDRGSCESRRNVCSLTLPNCSWGRMILGNEAVIAGRGHTVVLLVGWQSPAVFSGIFFPSRSERSGFLYNSTFLLEKIFLSFVVMQELLKTWNECSLMDQKPESKEKETQVYLSSLSHDPFGEEEWVTVF